MPFFPSNSPIRAHTAAWYATGKAASGPLWKQRTTIPPCTGQTPHEINSGLYLIRRGTAESLLPRLSSDNRGGEYYITDLVKLAADEGLDARGILLPAGDGGEALLGANTPAELAEAERLLQKRRVRELLEGGVILHAPESIRSALWRK